MAEGFATPKLSVRRFQPPESFADSHSQIRIGLNRFFRFEPLQPVRVEPIRETYYLSSHGEKRFDLSTDSDRRILPQIHGFTNHKAANPSVIPRVFYRTI